ncbi:MAG: FAD-binding oxidoreductase [Rhodospirillales bacterium]|jgi:glycine/D-amino acid oxidase-like deaminating enzyme|nr:FAD-binding oxidoreductase [Rhodospirillales bacterium]MBT4038981.1 FAD-binding oxidoreductase [Rhodospirillales bacterium]MBT4626653.1 FAD-binding oxidoreductase [Rhodospirillales bacterium]MBT5351875.1 FAD-binding oxidoreductase [Rhodospirillales bacterium]MBT5520637.1 FAD-binding oxidoreductase [Rhodospirillales bacterium]
MKLSDISHKDFELKPWWWNAYEPKVLDLVDIPQSADVAIIGAGYAGLATALELSKQGKSSVVFDAEQPGFGASTRSGGVVSGGRSVGKRYTSTSPAEAAHIADLRVDAADAFDLIEGLIRDNNIDCGWHKAGAFSGAWCRRHFNDMKSKVDDLNAVTEGDAYLVHPEQQREEIGSDYYRGGMVVNRGAHLHPALYFKGLLDLCQASDLITICAKAPVTDLNQSPAGWQVGTDRGATMAGDVVVATNGYTGNVTPDLKRRVVPVGSYMIATEELPDDLAKSLSPKNRAISDSRRVLCYYRMSPDGKRLLFGGRARFGQTDPAESAPILYKFMLDRYPQLKGTKITNSWTGNVAFSIDEVPHMGQYKGMHYALGCNGSGVAMMTYLGTQTARKIAGVANYQCAFDTPTMPTHPLYHGDPWFVPWVGRYFRTRDWIDRTFG